MLKPEFVVDETLQGDVIAMENIGYSIEKYSKLSVVLISSRPLPVGNEHNRSAIN